MCRKGEKVMEELQMIPWNNTEIATWDFPMIKAELQRRLDVYTGLVYTEENIKEAKNDRATLNKVKKAIEDAKKTYKAKCLAPYEALEPRIKELIVLVEAQKTLIDTQVKSFENIQKEEKEQEIHKYYVCKAVPLGAYAEALYPLLLDKKWLNASTSRKKYEEEIQRAVNNALSEINCIQSLESPFEEQLLELYVQTASLEQVQTKNTELLNSIKRAGIAQESDSALVQNPKPDLKVTVEEGGTLLRINTSSYLLAQVMDFMKALGISYEILQG